VHNDGLNRGTSLDFLRDSLVFRSLIRTFARFLSKYERNETLDVDILSSLLALDKVGRLILCSLNRSLRRSPYPLWRLCVRIVLQGR